MLSKGRTYTMEDLPPSKSTVEDVADLISQGCISAACVEYGVTPKATFDTDWYWKRRDTHWKEIGR